MAIVLGVMEVSGFIGGILKLVLAAGMLWCVGAVWWQIRSSPGGRGCIAVLAALALTVVLVPASLHLAIEALLEMFS